MQVMLIAKSIIYHAQTLIILHQNLLDLVRVIDNVRKIAHILKEGI